MRRPLAHLAHRLSKRHGQEGTTTENDSSSSVGVADFRGGGICGCRDGGCGRLHGAGRCGDHPARRWHRCRQWCTAARGSISGTDSLCGSDVDIDSSGGVATFGPFGIGSLRSLRRHQRHLCPCSCRRGDADSPGTVANFGSCGIGSRGGSDSDIDSSGVAAVSGPIGIGSRGSSDIVTGSRGSNGTDGPSHGSSDTDGPSHGSSDSDIDADSRGSSDSVTGDCWCWICDGPWCVRGG